MSFVAFTAPLRVSLRARPPTISVSSLFPSCIPSVARTLRCIPRAALSPPERRAAPTRATNHNVSLYPALPFLLSRRGLPINIPSEASSVTLRLIPSHSLAPSTVPFSLTLTVGASNSSWGLSRVNTSTLVLDIATDAPIGLYEVSDGTSSFQFAVLFNPFSPEDDVYMQDGKQRKEYVMNESGLIWRGSSRSNFPSGWDYAQFSEPVLRVALSLLDSLKPEKRADVVAVTRHLSAAVNVQDDNGVLVGRWDGQYSDGKAPTVWAGSKAICKQYLETGRPVKYGQCWVFAGVLTSICRTLGIPSRVETNFASAHDTSRPYNRAVDKYYDREGDLIEERSRDSIWNFHVWTGAWMRRKDLDEDMKKWGLDMNGWQAIDATPQETSQGLYQMGPASVNAVKHGIGSKYDVNFVIGEVNADVLYYWQNDNNDEFRLRDKRTRDVGKFMSTKGVRSDERTDVTLEYKFPEGSTEEREAIRRRPSANIEPISTSNNILAFDVLADARVSFGEPITCTVKVQNTGNRKTTVRMAALVRAIRYTGAATGTIENVRNVIDVNANETVEWVIKVDAEKYESKLVRDVQSVRFNISGKGTDGSLWAEETVVRVYGDEALQVTPLGKKRLGETGEIEVGVKNGFRVPLTEVSVDAEGNGIVEPVSVQVGRVEVGETKTVGIPYKAESVGEKTVVITLDTEELQDVSKTIKVEVVGEDGTLGNEDEDKEDEGNTGTGSSEATGDDDLSWWRRLLGTIA